MSDSATPGKSDTLSKMDALLKKHRGGGEDDGGVHPARAATPAPLAGHAPPPGAWLPVLTDVIERGTPPAAAEALQTASPESRAPAPVAKTAAPVVPPPVVSDALAEQLMSELTPRLSEVMERQVAAELRKNIDQTVSSLLNQLDENVREIVRDAVAEKLKKPGDPPA